MLRGIKARVQEIFRYIYYAHSVHNSCSLQHTELKIYVGSFYLIPYFVAPGTIVMGVSINYSLKIANFFKREH